MMEEIKIDKTINVKGDVCPFPWVKSKKALANMQIGQVLKIILDHAPAVENIPRYFTEEGQRVVGIEQLQECEWQIIVRREK
jgi:TusA-related sulfurtransferase